MSTTTAAAGSRSGYAWIVLSNLVFAVGYSFVPRIDGALSVWQLVLARGVVFALPLLPWAVRHSDIARGGDRKLLLLRGAVGTAMMLCLLWAITVLPLSVATLLGKTTPLWELSMLWLLLALRPHLSELLLVPVEMTSNSSSYLHPEGQLSLMALSHAALVLALAAGMLDGLELVALRRLRGSDEPPYDQSVVRDDVGMVALPVAVLQPWPDDPKVWLFVGMFCLFRPGRPVAAGRGHAPRVADLCERRRVARSGLCDPDRLGRVRPAAVGYGAGRDRAGAGASRPDRRSRGQAQRRARGCDPSLAARPRRRAVSGKGRHGPGQRAGLQECHAPTGISAARRAPLAILGDRCQAASRTSDRALFITMT